MNKYILTFGILLISATANAFSWSDLNPFSSDEKAETITMPTENEMKIKAAVTSIEQFFDGGSIVDITDEQKQLLKQSYDYLKQQEISDPELKATADKAINLIDSSGIFLEKEKVIDTLMQ